MTDKRVYNFSAGPSQLPVEVLKEAADQMLNYKGSGMSVMEMSHRSSTYQKIFDDTKATLKKVLNIPDNYKILLLQGGATQEFTNIALNLMVNGKSDYIVTGSFSGKAAKEAGVTISCDLNYRNKLWSKEKAGKVMAELCQYVDVCIANEEDAADVFGITSKGTDVTTGTVNREGYKDVAKQLADRFGFEKVAITLRESISANDNNWSAMLYDGKDYYFSKKYKMHIVDRVGGGDSFGGGLICACLNEYGPQETIEFAVAASCLKHSIEGDYNMVSMDEVLKLAGGDGSGRVQR